MSGGFLSVGRSAGLDGLKLRRYVRFMHICFPHEVKNLGKGKKSWLAWNWALQFRDETEYVLADPFKRTALTQIDGIYSGMNETKQRKKRFG